MKPLLPPLNPEEVTSLYLSGLSRDEVADKLNVSPHRVRSLIEKLGISRSQKEGTQLASTKYVVNERFFEHIDTLEKCWALGWFYTDGFNRASPPDARISLNEIDEEVLIKLKNLIGSTRPLQYEPKYHRISLIVSRRQFSEDLARHGCIQAKSLVIEYPHAILDTREKTCAFLRGVLEGDGCIHVSRLPTNRQGPYVAVTIACASSAFVSTLEEIFQSYWGLNGCIMKRQDQIIGIRFNAKRNKMKAMLDEIYNLKTLGLYLERKYQKYREASTLLGEMIANHYHQPWSKWGNSTFSPSVGV